jgi:hypothetical protein
MKLGVFELRIVVGCGAGLYLRVSLEEQKMRGSIQSQRDWSSLRKVILKRSLCLAPPQMRILAFRLAFGRARIQARLGTELT